MNLPSPLVSLTVGTALSLPLSAVLPPYPDSQLSDDERLPAPLSTPASDRGEKAIASFKIPDGFEVKLWAAEPMLANVVAFDFDERGRAFLAETHRYRSSVLDIRHYLEFLEHDMAIKTLEDRIAMTDAVFGDQAEELAIESELVRLVEDTDDDGVADSSKIFATGFDSKLDGIASGVLAMDGKVWFANIPSLWQFDTDDAGTTEMARHELLRGFGVRFGYTGHDFHGLAFGPDGKLYYSIGDRGTNVTAPDGTHIELPDEGAVFRSNPDGSALELVHRGLRNPQELIFDEYGNLFTGDNDCDNGDMERLVQVVEGGESGWRVGYQHAPLGRAGPWMSEDLWKPDFDGRAAYLLPPLANIEDGPSGITYYPGTGFDDRYDQTIFMTHFKGSVPRSGIQTYQIAPQGASFQVTQSEQFLWGTLPTDITFAPNGDFYFVDWVEGWPKSSRGRIYALKPTRRTPEQAALVAEVKSLIGGGIQASSDDTIGRLLGHPDQRVRLRTQYEIADRGPQFIEALQDYAIKGMTGTMEQLHRIHALWTLGMLQSQDDTALGILHELLSDPDDEVRVQAVKLAGDHHLAEFGNVLQHLLRDDSPRVQYFAAQSLGKLDDARAAPSLIELLRHNDNQDKYLRHAAIHALAQFEDFSALQAAEIDSSAAVRLGVLLAYRRQQNERAAQFLEDDDPFIVREAALAINDAPINAALPALAALLGKGDLDDEALQLRIINARHRTGRPADAVALAAFAANRNVPRELRNEALTQLASWGDPFHRDRLVGLYRPLPARSAGPAVAALEDQLDLLLADSSFFIKRAALKAIRGLKMNSATNQVRAIVASDQEDGEVRAEALAALDELNDRQLLTSVHIAGKSDSEKLRLATLPILARLSPQQALPILGDMATNGTPAEQQAAFRSLAELDDPVAAALLVAALDRLQAGEVPYLAQVELLDTVEASTATAVQERFAALKAHWIETGDKLAAYRGTLEGGDVNRGWRLFNQHPVLACTRCHRANGEGGYAGPDLSLITEWATPEYMLESIIDPNSAIAEGFDVVAFTLSDGGYEVGTIAEETAETITIYDANGEKKSFPAAQVTERAAAPSSMPAVFGLVLKRTEMRDLMAFMRSLNQERILANTENTRATHNE